MSVKVDTIHKDRAWPFDLAVEVSSDEVDSLIAPYVRRRFEATSPEWRELVVAQEKKWRRMYFKSRLRAFAGLPARGQGSVMKEYRRQWGGRTAVDVLMPKQGSSAVLWRDKGFLMDAKGLKRVHQLYLLRLIEQINPTSILEVGCGTGLNLFVMAANFPGINFSGIELTSEGVQGALAVQRMATLPREIASFSPLPPKDLSAHRRIRFQQASAANLPFEPGSFDLVFSCQALEQMKAVSDLAISQIRRVTRRGAVMIEPFSDYNEDQMRRHRIRSQAYFDASVADLASFDLKPAFICADIPAKIAMGVAVIAAAAV